MHTVPTFTQWVNEIRADMSRKMLKPPGAFTVNVPRFALLVRERAGNAGGVKI